MPIIRPSDVPQLGEGAQRNSFNAAIVTLETRVNDALRAAVRFPVSIDGSEDTRVREAIIARLVTGGMGCRAGLRVSARENHNPRHPAYDGHAVMVTYSFKRGADRTVLIVGTNGPDSAWCVYRALPGGEVEFVAGDPLPLRTGDARLVVSADKRDMARDVVLRVSIRDVAEDGFTRTVVLP